MEKKGEPGGDQSYTAHHIHCYICINHILKDNEKITYTLFFSPDKIILSGLNT